MKKSILTILTCLIAVFVFAQAPAKQDSAKRDTTYQLTMKIDQLRLLFHKIDVNVDSKNASKEILEFLQASAQMVQPADKPKAAEKPKKQ